MNTKDRSVFYVVVPFSTGTNTPIGLLAMGACIPHDLRGDRALSEDEQAALALRLGLGQSEDGDGYKAVFSYHELAVREQASSSLGAVYERRAKARKACDAINKVSSDWGPYSTWRVIQVGKLGREIKAIAKWRLEMRRTWQHEAGEGEWSFVDDALRRRDIRAERDAQKEQDYRLNILGQYEYQIVPVYA